MNKQDLQKYINLYHSEKGLGRKYAPFYPAESEGMQALILFTESLADDKPLNTEQSTRLIAILSREVSSELDWSGDQRLTDKIFKEILGKLKPASVYSYQNHLFSHADLADADFVVMSTQDSLSM
ncbi:MAG: hypothetical protein P4M12_11915 [Gammaproteobacteria bacterium]|nr:hypothetical protein [Gammaproteobacteria bacterium]